MPTKLSLIFLTALSFFAFSSHQILAVEAKLTLTDDTYISQSNPDTINGAKTSLSVSSQSTTDHNLIMLKFSTASIPVGSMISSATLLMTSYSCTGQNPKPTLLLSYADDDWTEETARWVGRPRIGMDFGPISALPATKSWIVTRAVSNWFQKPADNHGFVLAIEGTSYACNFYSKEKTTTPISLLVKYTPPVVDSTKPTISAIKAENVSLTSAVITWVTNEKSTSFVNFFTSSSGGTLPTILSAGQNDSTTTHSVTLSNLSSGKHYSFRVKSKDSAGNEAVSSYGSFTTKSLALIPSINVKIPLINIQNTPTPTPTSVPTLAPTPTIAPSETPEIITADDAISPPPEVSPTISIATSGAKIQPKETTISPTVVYLLVVTIALLTALVVISLEKLKFANGGQKVAKDSNMVEKEGSKNNPNGPPKTY